MSYITNNTKIQPTQITSWSCSPTSQTSQAFKHLTQLFYHIIMSGSQGYFEKVDKDKYPEAGSSASSLDFSGLKKEGRYFQPPGGSNRVPAPLKSRKRRMVVKSRHTVALPHCTSILPNEDLSIQIAEGGPDSEALAARAWHTLIQSHLTGYNEVTLNVFPA